MQQPYEIIHAVHEAYKALPVKLSRITGKSKDWHRSHGYQPRCENPLANGNKSGADAFMAQCELYEAAEPGAGRMLSSRLHGELEARFTENDLRGGASQADLHVGVIDESCDVEKWLARFDIKDATVRELRTFEAECDEGIQAIQKAKSAARAERLRKQLAEPARVA